MAERRWTIITGASAGIGVEFAKLFAAEGHGLVLVARRKHRLDTLAATLQDAHSIPTLTVDLDLSDADAPQALFDRVAAEGFVAHTLVNSAGFGLRGRFHTLPADRQAEMVQVNIAALTKLSRLFLPGMIERREGGLLNVASMAAFQAGPYMAVYYATKAYVLSLTEALHDEALPFGVHVSTLCPGPVATEFADVANFQGSKRFDNAVDAASVARIGLAGYRANKAIVIPGLLNRIGITLGKLAPRAVTRKAAARFQKLDL